MEALVLALTLLAGGSGAVQGQPPQAPLRVYSSPTLHVGVRPHLTAFGEEKGFAVTIQVTM